MAVLVQQPPFWGRGDCTQVVYLAAAFDGFSKKRAKNSFLVTIATNCHETSNLGEVMKSILIH